MPQLLVGECLGVKSEERKTRDGEPYTLETLAILVGYDRHFVRVVKDYAGALPTAGETVAIEVTTSAYMNRTDLTAQVSHNAHGRVKAAEKVARDLEPGLYMVGDVLGVERNGNAQTVIVLDGFNVHEVAVSSVWEGALPTRGEQVALQVAASAFPRGEKAAGYSFFASGRADALAAAITPASPVAAAS